MTSRGIILIICWILMILDWTTNMFPGSLVPLAFIASFVIMEWTGVFRKELAAYSTARVNRGQPEDHLTDRQKDFIEKMKQGVEEDSLDNVATIKTMDADGRVSSIFITEDGEVTTEGDPNPELVEAARSLQVSIIEHGPEAIAHELNKQIEKINKGRDNAK